MTLYREVFIVRDKNTASFILQTTSEDNVKSSNDAQGQHLFDQAGKTVICASKCVLLYYQYSNRNGK